VDLNPRRYEVDGIVERFFRPDFIHKVTPNHEYEFRLHGGKMKAMRA